MILAVTKLTQPLWAHRCISIGGRAVDINPIGAQIVNADGVLIQMAFKLLPTTLVTEMAQDKFQAIIGEMMITLSENRAEPAGAEPAHTEPVPAAMGGKRGVNQRRQVHALHLFDEHRNVVDALGGHVLDILHPQSLAPSSISLQIYANGKSDEEVRLLAQCGPQLKPLVVTALNTGFRLFELCSLIWADVNFSSGYITVRTAYAKNG